MPQSSGNEEKNYGALLLIGSVFTILGFLCAFNGFSMLMLYYQSGNWRETPVSIKEVELQVHRGERKTYSVRCIYGYEWGEKTYTGIRVGIESFTSADKFHIRRHNTLKKYQLEGRRFRALVNPKNPSEALLFREYQDAMTVYSMGGALFFVIGLCLMGWGLHTRQLVQKINREYPETPWQAETSFRDFIIKDNSLSDIGKAFATAILMGLFWSIFLFGFRISENGPLFAQIIIGIFVLITIGIFAYAVYRSLHYLKYGAPTLILSHIPIVSSRPFSGLLRMNRAIMPESGLHLTFTCMKEYLQEKNAYSKNRHVIKEAIYSDSLTLTEWQNAPIGQVWMFTFQVPDGYPSRNVTGVIKFRWLLKAKADMPAINFSVCFDLPVYEVSDEGNIRENGLFNRE